jgi:lipopolysaccharide/colanic/teichoic acid biosynthesis glycosyltransferase
MSRFAVKPRQLVIWIVAADLAWCAPAFVLAIVLRYGADWTTDRGIWGTLTPFIGATWVFWMLLSFLLGLDGFRGGWRFTAVASQVFFAVVCTLAALFAGAYLTQRFVSRLTLVYLGLLLFVGFIGIRCAVYSLLSARYRAGHFKRAVILGTGRIARELATKIERHPEMLCKVVGFLQPENIPLEVPFHQDSGAVVSVSTLGILDLLLSQRVDELILALHFSAYPEVLNLAGRCRDLGITVGLVPQPYELYLSKPQLLDLDGLPVLHFQAPSHSAVFGICKRSVDILLSASLMLVTAPIIASLAVWLRWRTGRAFREETRCGSHGRIFSMMRLNIDRPPAGDSRLEQMLDRLSFTELPQLWNVLRGEMSLVGPRPEAPDRVQRYSDWQRQRLSVKPGITGLAQVHGVRELHSSEEKTRFDLQYILNPSLGNDISLILQTCWTVAIRLIRPSKRVRPKQSDFFQAAAPHTGQFFEGKLTDAHSTQSSAD